MLPDGNTPEPIVGSKERPCTIKPLGSSKVIEVYGAAIDNTVRVSIVDYERLGKPADRWDLTPEHAQELIEGLAGAILSALESEIGDVTVTLLPEGA